MAWYGNTDCLTDANVSLFLDPDDSELKSCFSQISNFPQTAAAIAGNRLAVKQIADACDQLDQSMQRSITLIARLNEKITFSRLFFKKTQLKFPSQKTGIPNYNSCFYVGLEGVDQPIINLTNLRNDVRIEIRYPLFFEVDDSLIDNRLMHWQNGLPSLSLNGLVSEDDNFALLEKYTLPYLASLFDHVGGGNKLKVFGESLAERVLYQDLRQIFWVGGHWNIIHGERPIISRRTGSPLELDIQLKNHSAHIFIAFEIQGPLHYEKTNFHGTYERARANDLEKIEWCELNRVTLVSVKWTWYKETCLKKGDKGRTQETVALVSKLIELNKKGVYYVELPEDIKLLNEQQFDHNIDWTL